MKENYKFVALNIKPHPGVSEEKLIPALEKIMGALDKDLLSFKFQFSDEGTPADDQRSQRTFR